MRSRPGAAMAAKAKVDAATTKTNDSSTSQH
jgi:hypothetical protein